MSIFTRYYPLFMLHVALIGASEKPSLSQKLFFRLQEAGFQVAPVNPNCTKI